RGHRLRGRGRAQSISHLWPGRRPVSPLQTGRRRSDRAGAALDLLLSELSEMSTVGSVKVRSMNRQVRRVMGLVLAVVGGACGGGGGGAPKGPSSHVILIDIDDHGLAGLWQADAPNLKGLIARGTLAFSRVVVPTHSNQ